MREGLNRNGAGWIRPALWVVVAAIALGIGPAVPAWSAPPVEPEVIAAVEQDFRVLELEDGWLLEPLEADFELPAIQVKPGSFAIEGQRISEEELRARLGDRIEAADAIVELSDAAAEPDDRALGVAARTEEREIRAEERRLRAEERRLEAEAREIERRAKRHALHRDRSDSQVVVGSDLTIEEDDVYRDVVVFGGRLTVEGQVIGDAVAIGGSATVSGEITGDLAVVGGSIELENGARVMGDVVSVGGSIDQADDIDVAGQIIEVPFAPRLNFGNFQGWGNWGNWSDWSGNWDVSHDARRWGRHARWFGFFEAGWELLGVLFCALLACLVYLIARNPVERVARKVSDEPWKSGLVGLLVQILCLPVLVLVCVVLLISIIGIPLLLLVPFAILGFVLVAFLGYTASAFRLGGWSENRFGWNLGNPYLVLLLGVGLIEIWALAGEMFSFGPGPIRFFAAMFSLFGCLVIYVAWTVGLGGAVLTRFGTWGEPMSPPPLPPGPEEPAMGPDDGAASASHELADWDDAIDSPADPNGQDERL